ncbi:unnamed protein product [Phytophthora fragariaefolia]|uniref:Unnamed protein product n=1 Tax=Phytophthora fragariaefolia TaxID=1490495 RepID=A0A9W6TSG2_9STRA|nr:unnamed protein product [Phytophthora fragariaefolia]
MAALVGGADEGEARSKRAKLDEPWAAAGGERLVAADDAQSPAAPRVGGERRQVESKGDGSPRSMLDVLFPAGRAEPNAAGAGRTLKRKRRGARRADEAAGADVDLLRFGVDAAKLVPQGLVDRVDAHMSRAARGHVVGSHVANWGRRAGFAPGFQQELTTLLAAYYPCTYPTLLDEVLAGFLFQRPEFVELLLPPMLDKMSKSGESVATTKFPVADALARRCAPPTDPQAEARHDLACAALLRCLVENNGDRFVLSPWIVACASASSDSVLRTLWRALLPRPAMAEAKAEHLNWRGQEPGQQIVELLAEEGKLRACRMSCGFVELLFGDDDVQKQLVDSRPYLIADCLERAFKYAGTGWSASLMTEWQKRRRKQHRGAGSFKEFVSFLVRFNSKLSVKKPEWFVKHVLSFVLSPQCQVEEQEPALRTILRDYMSFVFGGADDQSLEQKSRQNGSSDSTAESGKAGTLDLVGNQGIREAQSKMELLGNLLATASARVSALFVDIWSEVWSDKRTTLSWGHVHALLGFVLQGSVEDQSEFEQKLQGLTTRVCRSFYYRLGRHVGNDNSHDEIAVKFAEALSILLPSARPVARILLQEVLGALSNFEQEHPADACTIFGNAITLQLGKCGGGAVDTVNRGVVQKSLVEYDRSPPNAANDAILPGYSTINAPLLSTLKSLAGMENQTGDFTRRVLSTGSLVRLFAGLLNVGQQRQRQEILLDVMNAVVTRNASAKRNRDWACQYAVQEIVYCAYTGPPSSARKSIALLQNIFRHCTDGVRALLWVVLQHCTKLCCGREETLMGDTRFSQSYNYQGRADSFAELVKAMVITVPTSTVREVLSFVEQKLSSCSIGKTRMNLFLLLLLRKLVVCELRCGVLLPVVQLAVCPLAPSDYDHIRLVQLQLLKALCSRLIAIQHRPTLVQQADSRAEWRRCEDLICNERLQSDLRSIVKVASLYGVHSKVERTSRASEVLAQGILAFSYQLKRQGPIDEEGARREGRIK